MFASAKKKPEIYRKYRNKDKVSFVSESMRGKKVNEAAMLIESAP